MIEDVIRQKLADSMELALPDLTPRTSVHLPAIPGKAKAVIGMRRAGKTSFLMQQIAEARASVPQVNEHAKNRETGEFVGPLNFINGLPDMPFDMKPLAFAVDHRVVSGRSRVLPAARGTCSRSPGAVTGLGPEHSGVRDPPVPVVLDQQSPATLSRGLAAHGGGW